MKKVLIVSKDLNLRQIVGLYLERNFEVDVVTKKSSAVAISALKSIQPDLIVADETAGQGAASKLLTETQKDDSPTTVVAILESLDSKPLGNLTFYYKMVKSTIQRDLDPCMKDVLIHDPSYYPKYLKIELEELLEIDNLGADCFVKLSDEKYIKILKEGDLFGSDDYDKYSKKGVTHLYVLSSDLAKIQERLKQNLETLQDLSLFTSPKSLTGLRRSFSEKEDQEVIDQIVHALEKTEHNELSYDESMKVSSSGLQTIRKTAKKIGFNQNLQQVAKATVLLSLSTIAQSPELSEMFNRFEADQDNYLNDHSTLLATISCQIAKLMGWTSNMTYYKLTLSALLHDITLTNPKLAKFRGIADLMLKADEFSEDEIDSFVNHTSAASKIISQFRMIPPDTDTIIAQHHERPDQSGFPHKLDHSNIAPLACVIIIAHDLVSFIYNREKSQIKDQKDWNLVSFLNQHRMLYQTGTFKDIFTVMWNQVVNKS